MTDRAENPTRPGAEPSSPTREDAETPQDSQAQDPQAQEPQIRDAQDGGEGKRAPKVVIASEDGVGMADTSEDPTQGVPEPAKVMRIGTMIKQLLEEVKSAPLDEAARDHLADLHSRSVQELKGALSEELAEEIDRIVLPLAETPSEAELRVAQAQLVGWLEGLFHGIQTALVAQQMLAQNQLQSMRKALPPGLVQAPQQAMRRGDEGRPGQYL